MLTHPMVVKGVVEYVLDRGGRVQISDSPAMGPLKGAEGEWHRGSPQGFKRRLYRIQGVSGHRCGGTLQEIEIARDALEADVLINLRS